METDGTDGRAQVTGWPTVQVGLALYPASILALGLELLRPMLEGVVKQNISKFFLPPKDNIPLSPLSKPDTTKGSDTTIGIQLYILHMLHCGEQKYFSY